MAENFQTKTVTTQVIIIIPNNLQTQIEVNTNQDRHGADGDENTLSPRSLEHLNNISHGISQLVDDIISPPQDSKGPVNQLKNLSISEFQDSKIKTINDKGIFDSKQNVFINANNDNAGATPLPMHSLYSEGFQGGVRGIGEFQNVVNTSKGQYSQYQEKIFQQNQSSDDDRAYSQASDLAVGTLSQNPLGDDQQSINSIFEKTSDYHEQLQRFGYIFQSPDLGQRQAHQFQGYQHFKNPYQGGHYHQNTKPTLGIQQRASSFDKVNQYNEQQYSNFYPIHGNQEIDTYSAASSGNHSALSDGDIYIQNQTSINYTVGNNPFVGVPSNRAAYGFSPQIQFPGSNQNQQNGYPINYLNGVTPVYYQEELGEELTPTNQLLHADININLGQSPKRNCNELQGMYSAKQQNMYAQYSQEQEQYFGQFKTPSPYRNSDGALQYGGHQTTAPHSQARNLKQNQQADPFYPVQAQSQKNHMPNKQGQMMQNSQRSMMPTGQFYVNQQYDNIGLTAPPMTRGIGFNQYNEMDMQYGINHMPIHGGPMIALQKQQIQQNFNIPQFKQYPPQPITVHGQQKTTNSQERDPSYQTSNFIQSQVQFPKTVDNTPTHDHEQKSASSNNSYLSQQFSGLIMDNNETFLFQIIKQFDECQNPQLRSDILRGNVHKLALTQTGSRFLQKQLTKANSNIVSFFLEDISEHMPSLMVDNYGNYFCQKLLSSCSGDQRLSILRMIKARFIEICCNKKGTHTIQTMFDLVNLPEEEDFIRSSLIGNVLPLSLDAQGTHVVQKVLSSFEEPRRKFIFDEVFDHFIELAMNTNGLCVVKKLVQNITNLEQISQLMNKIAENVIELVQNPFGNYAVTEVLNHWDNETCKPIFLKLRNKISQLSIQKFSSNVIEKCLEKADPKIKSIYIEEITNSEKLAGIIIKSNYHYIGLIRNSYGNYVVQKTLKIALGKDKQMLIAAIQKSIPQITDRKIRQKWESILQEAIKQGDQTTNIFEDDEQSHRFVTMTKRTNSSDNVN